MAYLWLGVALGLLLGVVGAAIYTRGMLRRGRQAELRARSGERLAHLGTLAGGLAHEIKNPLSTFNLNLQLLEEDLRSLHLEKEQRLVSRTAALRAEVRRLEEVLEDFLRYARGHKLQLVPLDVNALLDEVLDFVQPEVSRADVRINRGYEPNLPPLSADAGRLKQAFLNIIINAQQAMPEGGELIVRTRRAGDGIETDFIDTGVGIASEDLSRIWDVYHSTKERGTGLGLPTARRIVEEHEGTIRVHSEQGKGTCFTVSLPLKESKG